MEPICDCCGAPATGWFKHKALRVCGNPECHLYFEKKNPINAKLYRPEGKKRASQT